MLLSSEAGKIDCLNDAIHKSISSILIHSKHINAGKHPRFAAWSGSFWWHYVHERWRLCRSLQQSRVQRKLWCRSHLFFPGYCTQHLPVHWHYSSDPQGRLHQFRYQGLKPENAWLVTDACAASEVPWWMCVAARRSQFAYFDCSTPVNPDVLVQQSLFENCSCFLSFLSASQCAAVYRRLDQSWTLVVPLGRLSLLPTSRGTVHRAFTRGCRNRSNEEGIFFFAKEHGQGKVCCKLQVTHWGHYFNAMKPDILLGAVEWFPC